MESESIDVLYLFIAEKMQTRERILQRPNNHEAKHEIADVRNG